jgi:hypothetical protein
VTAIHYDLIAGNRGRLLSALEFESGIKGHVVNDPALAFYLAPDGCLTLYTGFEWDFASGAIDTPAMVIASAYHDAGCVMTDKGLLPWKYRAHFDKQFRELLKENGVGFARRWWCWAGVRTYSKTVAYWNRSKAAMP